MGSPASIEEWGRRDDPRAEITPLLLMQMASGLEWEESSDVFDLVAGTSTTNVAGARIRAGRTSAFGMSSSALVANRVPMDNGPCGMLEGVTAR